jgi:type III pantothenate kinase
MPIRYDNPHEVGADRIVNAIAAYDKYKQSLVVVDFGTATTFDYVSPRGEYMGGAIAPGIVISSEALFVRASKLPRIELIRPESVIGKNTIASLQSGIVFGYIAMVDGIVEKIKQEVKTNPRIIATGGLAPLIAEGSKTIEEVDPLLTLTGLRLIYEKNLGEKGEAD